MPDTSASSPSVPKDFKHESGGQNLIGFPSQRTHFGKEVKALEMKAPISQSSVLVSVNPFLDKDQLLRVGGRESNSKLPYENQHPLIVHGKDPLTKLLIRSEHSRLLHAGPTLLTASLSRQFHIIGC